MLVDIPAYRYNIKVLKKKRNAPAFSCDISFLILKFEL